MLKLHAKEIQVYASLLLLPLDKHLESLAACAVMLFREHLVIVQFPSKVTSNKTTWKINKIPKQIAGELHIPHSSISEGPIIVHVHEVTDLEVPREP